MRVFLIYWKLRAEHAAHGVHDPRDVRVHPHALASPGHGGMQVTTLLRARLAQPGICAHARTNENKHAYLITAHRSF